jgi:hypothetical protein
MSEEHGHPLTTECLECFDQVLEALSGMKVYSKWPEPTPIGTTIEWVSTWDTEQPKEAF